MKQKSDVHRRRGLVFKVSRSSESLGVAAREVYVRDQCDWSTPSRDSYAMRSQRNGNDALRRGAGRSRAQLSDLPRSTGPGDPGTSHTII
jgi:hypothetical protein